MDLQKTVNNLQPVSSKPRQLTKTQQAIADLAMSDNTLLANEIAEKLGCDKTTVYKVLQKQHVREYILANVHASLLLSAPEAMSVQRSLLSSKSDYIRNKAASDLLDRNEVGASNAVIGQTVNVVIDLS